uniref:glucose-6-phosphate 1-epimerase n=1 Tax=Lygus hesperus TaxID=30085 RepID=A0A146L702_LYGHE
MAPAHEQNTILLERGEGTSCTINLHGATLTSWKVDGQEQLFVSSKAVFDGKSPIRGGIPIAFPKFGDWEGKPLHGFARVCKWKLLSEIEHLANGDIKAKLVLEDNDYTRSLWGFQFRLVYTVLLGEKQLKTKVTVFNPSKDTKFDFELLLHTYFRIKDVRQVTVCGLKGEKYKKKLDDSETIEDGEDCVHVDGFISRFYSDTPAIYEIVTPERTTSVIKCNFPDTVIWNPWEDVAKTIPDLSDEEYNRFICVEAGSFLGPAKLPPGGTVEIEAFQSLQVL